ncbi:MAG TPA: AAA family ATPase [Pyrinomonadaceae bacterium]|jgi:predicted ATPase|nr:AAA family ATPase [Pyrinomonadaceae bacterium]
MTIHLRSISLSPAAKRLEAFPFSLPVVRKFRELKLRRAVTFLVGENGSGKSTLIEALAAAVGSVVVGGEDVRSDKTLAHARALGSKLKLVWQNRTHRGFFLRAEDFFNFAKRVNQTSAELEEMAEEFEREGLKGYGLRLAQGVVRGQRRALTNRYGEDADARSHGEGFLNLFQSRFVPGGLYLLDEPEAPLSPQRQLALLSMLKEMTGQDSQFVIATHSPILMALPGADILSFDHAPIRRVPYDEVEHVSLTRDFLNNPEAFLRRL